MRQIDWEEIWGMCKTEQGWRCTADLCGFGTSNAISARQHANRHSAYDFPWGRGKAAERPLEVLMSTLHEEMGEMISEYKVQVVTETEAWYTGLIQQQVDTWNRIIGDRQPGHSDTIDRIYSQIGTARSIIRMLNGGVLPGVDE